MMDLYFPAPADRPESPHAIEWISLCGPDAGDFLQRLTTANVGGLLPGTGTPGFFLTAQGKIRAAFRVWRYGSEEYGFEVEVGPEGLWRKSLLETIDQFTFAEKMTLTEVPELACAWLFASDLSEVHPKLPSLQPGETVALDDEIRLCAHGTRDFGKVWYSAWGREVRLHQWLERELGLARSTLTSTEVDALRIQALRGSVPQEITPEVNPLEIGWFDGVATNKGCYPGQEVIERIAALGAPARRLCLIQGAGEPPAAGTELFNDAETPVKTGIVTRATSNGGDYLALALMQKLHAKEGLPVRSLTGVRGSIVRVSNYV